MKVYRYLIPFIALLILAVPALADVTTMLTLDGVPADVVCGQVWQENQVDLSFVPTTGEDCAEGNCYFGTDVDGVWLYPCRLLVDFGQSYNVISVEIDWADYCGVGCTNAFLYNGGATVASASNTLVSTPETVNMVPVGGICDSIAVSSCEGKILEIRIVADTVPDGKTTWGQVKSLFR